MHIERRLNLAIRSLKGLSVGDAIGRALANPAAGTPVFSPRPWNYTDDTEMAIAIVDMLAARGEVDQDALAQSFAARFSARPDRGYGAVAHWILTRIAEGNPWREVSSTPYSGSGSMGNGAAMRVAPLGAYFFDDRARLIEQARLSAAVTHAHPQGCAGAVAVAVAAAYAVSNPSATVQDLLEVSRSIPDVELRHAVERASELDRAEPREAGRLLGTGSRVIAIDTVPFALWAAFSHLNDFRAAVSAAITGFVEPDSDADTICAIVAGVTALAADPSSRPSEWLAVAEKLPPHLEERHDFI